MRAQKLLLLAFAVTALAFSVQADSLRLKTTVAERDFAAGLPIVIDVEVSTEGAIELPAISPGAGNVRVWIEDTTGSRKRYLGPLWGIDENAPERVTVTPESPLRASITLLVHNVIEGHEDLADTRLPFGPASYRITVEYLGAGHDLSLADSVTIAVREPRTPGERAYRDAMGADPDLAAAIQTGTFARHPELFTSAEQLLREHPEPDHATVTALAVGAHILHVGNDAATAERILNRAATRETNAFVHARVLQELASAQVAQRKFAAATATIERALTASRDQTLSLELRHLRDTILTGEDRRTSRVR